eukprot:3774663-Pyramimonas_sp.AAC.1
MDIHVTGAYNRRAAITNPHNMCNGHLRNTPFCRVARDLCWEAFAQQEKPNGSPETALRIPFFYPSLHLAFSLAPPNYTLGHSLSPPLPMSSVFVA